jgi:hypothetical protein
LVANAERLRKVFHGRVIALGRPRVSRYGIFDEASQQAETSLLILSPGLVLRAGAGCA